MSIAVSPRRLLLSTCALLVCLLAVAAVHAGSASAAGGWWVLGATSAPTDLQPGQEALIQAQAVNSGYAPIESTSKKAPIVLSDTLPAGLEIVGVTGEAGPTTTNNLVTPPRVKHFLTCTHEGSVASCPWVGAIEQTESMRMTIVVKVAAEAAEGPVTSRVTLTGGDVAAPAPFAATLNVSKAATPFGVEDYEYRPEGPNGEIETQAGGHPFQLTTVFDLNESRILEAPNGGTPKPTPSAPALPKNLHFVLPPGLIGKAAKVPRCTGADFAAITPGAADLCPEDTAIGYAVVAINDPVILGYEQFTVPVFNLSPSNGEPARFGFDVHDVPVVLTTHVRSGSDYAIEVTVNEATENSAVLSTQLTLWGVPNDPRHDSERGWECLEKGWWINAEKTCKTAEELEAENGGTGPEAFLTMPPYCTGAAPVTTATGEAWNGATFGGGEKEQFTFKPFTGCEKLPFEPSIEVAPDHQTAATPSGMTVAVNVPQQTTLSGEEGAIAEADISSTTLALPEGVVPSAGATDGLLTCSAEGVGFEGVESEFTRVLENDHFNQNPVNATTCPDAAKIGTVDIETPLLEEHLTGSVYLASKDTNPFGSPLALYIFAESPISKVQVKLAGEVQIGPTGQLTSTFKNTPPVPFSRLILHLLDGPRASQSTPEACGTYSSTASFASSSGASHESSSSFAITSGPGGSACAAPGTQPFAPGFEAKSESGQAGAFSPFVVTIERPDGQQALRTVSVTEPPGASAMLSSVTPCPIALALAPTPTCPASSRVGESTALAGFGTDHAAIPGEVFLTASPRPGVPFGLLSVSNAEHVGPFNLGLISVMSGITVNETTAQATVTSEPLPQYVRNVPSQIHALRIDVNRPGFTFNPTNCSPLAVTGTLTGYGPGGSVGAESVSSPYHAANCASLPFKPQLSMELEPDVSRVDGTGLVVKVKAAKGEANIHKTKLVFPTSIPSRLTTIQKACDDHIFNVNPANCPEGSVIGTAIAKTPVLKSPLVGPAYLVSHANASFPDAEFVLQGEGIKLVLDGKTDIKKGITSSSFESVPDAPVETFEVKLPRGPHSAFSGYGDLCATAQNLPTEFVGQNGVTITQTTRAKLVASINTGSNAVCANTAVKKPETELQKLLKKCKKLKNKSKRVKCEATARKQVKAVATCKKKNKKHKKKMNGCIAKARKTYALKLK